MKNQQQIIIANKYSLLDLLGKGGMATTYTAENIETQAKVAIKILSLNKIDRWKTLELFEREAKILAQLDLPAIPEYIDYFQEDSAETHNFYLVQQLAPGKPLSTWLKEQWYPDIVEVKNLAIKLLEVLAYLQQLTPPIIHRDIKPQNIIRQADGSIFLVDFGAVQDVYHHTVTGGSTVVGTFGYMAPEQFRGQANLATDLYGLGTTLLHLLTRQEPDRLPQKNFKINFRPYVNLDRDFANWLDKIIEPVSEDRFSSAAEALAVLKGEKKLTRSGIETNSAAKKCISSIEIDREQLVIKIPGAWSYSSSCQFIVSLITTYNLGCFFILIIIYQSGLLGAVNLSTLWVAPIPLLGFIFGISALVYFYLIAFFELKIRIDSKFVRCEQKNKHFKFYKRYFKEDLSDLRQINLYHLGEPLFKNIATACYLEVAATKLRFGLFLPRKEQKYLLTQIDNFLQAREKVD